MSATTHAAAPDLPGILPVPKERGRIAGFIYRHPTIFVGGLLIGLMIFIAIFAPYLGTKDPTALAPGAPHPGTFRVVLVRHRHARARRLFARACTARGCR